MKPDDIDLLFEKQLNSLEKEKYIDSFYKGLPAEYPFDRTTPILYPYSPTLVSKLPESVTVTRKAIGDKATKAGLLGGAVGFLVAGPLGWFVGGLVAGGAAMISEEIETMNWSEVKTDTDLYQNVQAAVRSGETSGSYIMGSDKIYFHINY